MKCERKAQEGTVFKEKAGASRKDNRGNEMFPCWSKRRHQQTGEGKKPPKTFPVNKGSFFISWRWAIPGIVPVTAEKSPRKEQKPPLLSLHLHLHKAPESDGPRWLQLNWCCARQDTGSRSTLHRQRDRKGPNGPFSVSDHTFHLQKQCFPLGAGRKNQGLLRCWQTQGCTMQHVTESSLHGLCLFG